MSTFTKRSIIVWSRDSYVSMVGTVEAPTTNEAFNEFDEKTQEFIDDNKMDSEFSELRNDEATNTVTSIKHLVDETAAQEWIDYCKSLATKYNLTMISSRIRPII